MGIDEEEENIEVKNDEFEGENINREDSYFEGKNDNKKTIYGEIVEYLNNKCGKSYREKSEITQRLIKERIREGFGIEDFIKVIDRKYEQWSNSYMARYLRPETLFGEKFERYLSESEMNMRASVFSNSSNNKYGQAYKSGYNNFESSNNYNEGRGFKNTASTSWEC